MYENLLKYVCTILNGTLNYHIRALIIINTVHLRLKCICYL